MGIGENFGQRFDFDTVAQERAGGVGFDHPDGAGRYGDLLYVPQERGLGATAWRRDAIGLPL